jgi:hypothetical protein
MSDQDYWDCLVSLWLYSQQTKRKRYQMIVIEEAIRCSGPPLTASTYLCQKGKRVFPPVEGGQAVQLHPQRDGGHLHREP